MKILLPFIFFTFFSEIANAQLYKGTWLLGGAGKVYSYNGTRTNASVNNTSKNLNVELSPSLGYFLIDKLAVGLRPTFLWNKQNIDNGSTLISEKRLSIGPFVRYYLLNMDNKYNIAADVSYQYGVYRFYGLKGTINTFNIMAGPEIFISESVGLEFLLGYSHRVEDVTNAYKDTRKGLQVSFGFQIHLGNESMY